MTHPSSYNYLCFTSQCISDYYHEDPDSYTKEFIELEQLRGLACRPRVDIDCVAAVKRYYAQLHSLENRFPLSSENELIEFSWKDIYSSYNFKTNSVKYEMASTLYNIAALYTQLAVEESREDPDSMKLACTYFQCASWAFGELKSQFSDYLRGDLCTDLMIFKQNICLAQAQECILEKSLADNRKAQIVAKVTAQVITFYTSAVTALYGQNEDGLIQDFIGSKLYKDWTRYIKFKTSYLSSILFLYQGIHSEEQRKMGERVALFNAACDKLEEAKKESKGMSKIDVINEAMVLMTDIVEGKRKNAKQENEFIYHESLPEVSSLSAVQGASLVQGIPFDVTDSQVIGEDIFKRLVPMKAHEHLSVYSEEKANILRALGAQIDERDAELSSFMGSLNKEMLKSMDESYDPIPQPVVDRCAELSAQPSAIPDLVDSMSKLAETSLEVESTLKDIKNIIDEEIKRENEFQKQMGKRPTGHMTELTREYTKYIEAHLKASESNDTLRKAMELHVSNLKILTQPLVTLRTLVPQSNPIDETTRKELHVLLNKVEEMKNQRDDLFNDLREEILNRDDITAQLIAHGEKNVEELFKKELGKYSKSVKVIELNLEAQGNILRALTDTYAKHAMTLKAFNDTKLKREQFYSSLVASYDIYEDLMTKSVKGHDFYKKLQTNIMKLLSRVKAARDVQEEEREQLLKSLVKQPIVEPITKPVDRTYKSSTMTPNIPSNNNMKTSGPGMKLKDYLKSGMVPGMAPRDDSYNKLPAVRPSPVGQENISATNPVSCQSISMSQYPVNVGYQNYPVQQPPIDQQSNGSGSMTSSTTSLNAGDVSHSSASQGYLNPIYQNQPIDYSHMNQYSTNYGNVAAPGNTSNTQPQQHYGDYYAPQSQTPPVAPHQSATAAPKVDMNASTNNFYPQNYQSQQQSQLQTYQQGYQQYPQYPTNTVNANQAHQYPTSQSPALNANNQQYAGQLNQNTHNYSNCQQPTVASQSMPSTQNIQPQQQITSNAYSNQMTTNPATVNTQQPVANYQTGNPTSNLQQMNYASYQNQMYQQPQAQNVHQINQYGIQNSQNSAQNFSAASTAYYPTNYQQTQTQVNVPNSNSVTDSANYYQNNTQNVITGQQQQTTMNAQHPYSTINSYGQNQNVENVTYSPSPQQNTTVQQQPQQVEYQQPIPQQQPVAATPAQQNSIVQPQAPPKPAPKRSSNIDLLADIDFSISSIPTLTPVKTDESPKKIQEPLTPVAETKPVAPVKLNEDLADLDLSVASVSISENNSAQPNKEPEKSKRTEDPFDDANVLKLFHKEVESLEKFMDTLTVKTLSGTTPLVNKWKELQDKLAKDESKRTVTVAKLFPEKNRNIDYLPYDHARIALPSTTDNYINAAIIKDCGQIPFIITQTPLSNTVNDYWEMVLSQKTNVLVCLHNVNEVSGQHSR